MGNLHLVTGYAGQPHVTAADQGSLFEALIRGGQFVMEAGANFSATAVTNNQIRVSDGELMMQGRHVKLTPGAYVDLTIENGAQGYLRNDLIVARYTRNSDNGIEECNLVVLKGTPAESNPSDPEYTTGSLNAYGALQHDFPLYRVPLSGLAVGELVALFKPQKSIYNDILPRSGGMMAGDIAMDGHKVTGIGTPTANSDAVPLGYANGAFAPAGLSSGSFSVLTEDELTTAMSDTYNAMRDGSVKIIRLNVNADELSLPGGVWFVTLYRTSPQFGYAEAVTYVDAGLVCSNTIYDGVWTGWKNRNAYLEQQLASKALAPIISETDITAGSAASDGRPYHVIE